MVWFDIIRAGEKGGKKMRFTTKTEYGLICLIYMVNHGEGRPITSKGIVRDEQYSLAFIEKILQRLRTAGIIKSQQGNQGGYVLAKDPGMITLREVVEALEGSTFEAFCEPQVRSEIVCTHFHRCGVMPIWLKTKELLDIYYGAVTLEMLSKGEKHLPSPKNFQAGKAAEYGG